VQSTMAHTIEIRRLQSGVAHDELLVREEEQ
jgi:hypothetical protein